VQLLRDNFIDAKPLIEIMYGGSAYYILLIFAEFIQEVHAWYVAATDSILPRSNCLWSRISLSISIIKYTTNAQTCSNSVILFLPCKLASVAPLICSQVHYGYSHLRRRIENVGRFYDNLRLNEMFSLEWHRKIDELLWVLLLFSYYDEGRTLPLSL
jgi:hypothetical protein